MNLGFQHQLGVRLGRSAKWMLILSKRRTAIFHVDLTYSKLS